ncbi:hypothetical protein Q3G72_019749 [Acer saccharum]|nr:hypothetical protein Q3G72_019749 [Acer saccharum]
MEDILIERSLESGGFAKRARLEDVNGYGVDNLRKEAMRSFKSKLIGKRNYGNGGRNGNSGFGSGSSTWRGGYGGKYYGNGGKNSGEFADGSIDKGINSKTTKIDKNFGVEKNFNTNRIGRYRFDSLSEAMDVTMNENNGQVLKNSSGDNMQKEKEALIKITNKREGKIVKNKSMRKKVDKPANKNGCLKKGVEYQGEASGSLRVIANKNKKQFQKL